MSNAVLPVLPGLAWPVIQRPTFNTRKQRSVSGKRVVSPFMLYPLWEIEQQYEFLRDTTTYNEFRSLMGFFLSRLGGYDSFLYNNPNDNNVSAYQFGIGDGATTAFQLTRAFGGFVEPVQNINGTPSIYRNDWQGNQLMYATARTNSTLWSNDLTNAAWVKTTATVAKDQTGPDGIANGSSSFLATAANATVLQSVTLVSAQEAYGVWLQRLIGTGAVQLTLDGGATWTTVAITASWAKYSITQTLANPNFGIRLTTNADKIAVGFSQLEPGATATSSIQTTTAPVAVTDYALSNLGIATFSPAPLVGAALTWTGNYYYRCEFSDDYLDLENFMNALWRLNKLKMISVKL